MSTRTIPIALLSWFALAACSEAEPSSCRGLRSCCDSLEPGLGEVCQQSLTQALELDAVEAGRACQGTLASLRASGACGSTPPPVPDAAVTTGPDGGPGDPPADAGLERLPPSQGLSEPCDPGWGLDACGAGLFCAAFDGRTVSTCYAEGVRRGGETCGEDRHCSNRSCALPAGRCRADAYQSCSPDLGCAGRYVC
jgi:hypothetical protein